jgi:hypothetical protein
MIYVGPAGQLIGSLKPPQTFQIPGIGGAQPGTPAGVNAQQGTGSGFGLSNATPTANPTGQPGSQASGQSNNAAADNAATATPSGLLNSDSPLIGGNIIGVGSKVNKRSVIVYDKAKNYRLFEFVWNPSKDLANALNQGGAGTQVGTPNPNRQGIGQSGFGQPPAPTNPTDPTQPLSAPPQNPNPAPPPR